MKMNYIDNCTGVILAGGENRRMPVTKYLIEVEGKKIIKRSLDAFTDLFEDIFIVTNQPESALYSNVKLFGDVYNIRGPMTGILTALLNTSNRWVFITACDMPFINRELVRYMALKRPSFDAVIPLYRKKPEPLFAFYSKKLLSSLENALLDGNKSIKDFLNSKKVKYITTEEIRSIDAEAESLVNLNTPEDVLKHLTKKDIRIFKRDLTRRKICSDLAQQS